MLDQRHRPCNRSYFSVFLLMAALLVVISAGCGGSGGSSSTAGSSSGSAGSTAGSEPSFTTIPNTYGFLSVVSPNGTYVAAEAKGGHLVRIRTSDGHTDDLGAFSTGGLVPSAISNDGTTITGTDDRSSDTSTLYVPFRWQEGTGFSQVGSFGHSTADGASIDLRTIVGSARIDGAWKPFVWKDGVVTSLPIPSTATDGFAKAVAQNGTTYGYVLTGEQTQVVRWVNGHVEVVGEPYADTSGSLTLASSGSMIGIRVDNAAALLTATGIQTTVTGNLTSRFYGLSKDGSVAVGDRQLDGGSAPDAFLYRSATHASTSLRDVLIAAGLETALGETQLTRATDVSDDGKVVIGWSKAADADSTFIARLP